MGKRSVKENKNMYQLYREDAELTREQAAEKMIFVSSDRIEKIESGRSAPHPDEIIAMADCYHAPALKNRFCATECPLGALTVAEIPEKDLPRIVLELLSELSALSKDRERLIEIAADGKIKNDEQEDFDRIRSKLANISLLSGSLQLWMEKEQYDE